MHIRTDPALHGKLSKKSSLPRLIDENGRGAQRSDDSSKLKQEQDQWLKSYTEDLKKQDLEVHLGSKVPLSSCFIVPTFVKRTLYDEKRNEIRETAFQNEKNLLQQKAFQYSKLKYFEPLLNLGQILYVKKEGNTIEIHYDPTSNLTNNATFINILYDFLNGENFPKLTFVSEDQSRIKEILGQSDILDSEKANIIKLAQEKFVEFCLCVDSEVYNPEIHVPRDFLRPSLQSLLSEGQKISESKNLEILERKQKLEEFTNPVNPGKITKYSIQDYKLTVTYDPLQTNCDNQWALNRLLNNQNSEGVPSYIPIDEVSDVTLVPLIGDDVS